MLVKLCTIYGMTEWLMQVSVRHDHNVLTSAKCHHNGPKYTSGSGHITSEPSCQFLVREGTESSVPEPSYK